MHRLSREDQKRMLMANTCLSRATPEPNPHRYEGPSAHSLHEVYKRTDIYKAYLLKHWSDCKEEHTLPSGDTVDFFIPSQETVLIGLDDQKHFAMDNHPVALAKLKCRYLQCRNPGLKIVPFCLNIESSLEDLIVQLH